MFIGKTYFLECSFDNSLVTFNILCNLSTALRISQSDSNMSKKHESKPKERTASDTLSHLAFLIGDDQFDK